MRAVIAGVFVCAAAVTLTAKAGGPDDVPGRAKAAERVVVASVVDVSSRFDVTAWGDRVIVSDSVMEVEETLKGGRASRISVTTEGGTVGDLSLAVSDMPEMKKGDRAILFLNSTASGGHVPVGRGDGVLKLDRNNRVEDSDLTLDDVKRHVGNAR